MNMTTDFRILVTGQPGSGREALCTRLRTGRYTPPSPNTDYDPTLMEPMTKWESIIDCHRCTIEAVVAGTGDLSNHFVKGTLLGRGIHGAVVTCDATSREAFASIESQVLEIRELGAGHLPEGLGYPIAVAATKMDLVDASENLRMGEDLVARLGLIGVFQTSAVSGEGGERPFSSVVREVWKRDGGPLREEEPTTVLPEDREDMQTEKSGWSINLKAKLRGFLS